MGEAISREQMRDQRDEGDQFEIHDDGRRSIDGLEELVAEIRALVEAQRANAGADMQRSETQSGLIAAIQKIAARPSSGGMTQEVLENLVVQLGEQKECCDPVVYVFDIERNQTTGYIQRIKATPSTPENIISPHISY